MWNNWIAAASCPWPAYPGPVKGTPPINHCRFKKWVTGDLGRQKGRKNALYAGCLTNVWPRVFCTLQCTAIHSGAILSAFFSFISKLLKTTLWMGRWNMSFLLHAISHHPCLPLSAYIHTSFNSNRKSKWREKHPAWAFSCVSSVINHWPSSG